MRVEVMFFENWNRQIKIVDELVFVFSLRDFLLTSCNTWIKSEEEISFLGFVFMII